MLPPGEPTNEAATNLAAAPDECACKCGFPSRQTSKKRSNSGSTKGNRGANSTRSRRPRFRFSKIMKTEGTNYDLITSIEYLNEKFGIRKSHYIEKFLKCIHSKMDHDVNRISDKYVNALNPWVKIKFFLLLVTLSQRGGPEYWMDKNDQEKISSTNAAARMKQQAQMPSKDSNSIFSLTEQIMRHNINHDFTESTYDENYVFSSIWANFMEGLINHYLEQVIVPHSEMKVCQQLYKPMMKIISLYNEYNELMEKGERNGFLPPLNELSHDNAETENSIKGDKIVVAKQKQEEDLRDGSSPNEKATQERLQRAQKLLWQARQDIPKTISKELTLLSEMYSTLSADEQDYELDEFVCCAEEYIELEYLPSLIDVLFKNCGTIHFWKIMIALEPFFYYIEDFGEEEDTEGDVVSDELIAEEGLVNEIGQPLKPDQRVVILEKICEVAARQKWI